MINNRNEALEIMGFAATDNPTPEEVDKKFKKKAAKLHPDVNKAEDAEEQFKKLNSARDYLKNPPPPPGPQFRSGSPWGGNVRVDNIKFEVEDLGDILGGFRSSVMFTTPPPIKIRLPLSFKESVLGAKKTMKFPRRTPCQTCSGRGRSPTTTDCSHCDGKGYEEEIRGQFVMRRGCNHCLGSGKDLEDCSVCETKGFQTEELKVDFTIPGGLVNGSVVNLRQKGNIDVQNGRVLVGDVHLIAKVEKKLGLSIQGQNVISTVDISLRDALKGSEKEVKTILGDKTITIKPKTKHKDQITLPGLGVNLKGNQIVTINVHYPSDVKELVEFLEKEKTNGDEHSVQQ